MKRTFLACKFFSNFCTHDRTPICKFMQNVSSRQVCVTRCLQLLGNIKHDARNTSQAHTLAPQSLQATWTSIITTQFISCSPFWESSSPSLFNKYLRKPCSKHPLTAPCPNHSNPFPLPQTNCQTHMDVPPSIHLWIRSVHLRLLIQNKIFVYWLGHSCLPYHSFISFFTSMHKSTLQQNDKMDQPVTRHGRSGDRLPVRKRNSAPVQTGPGAHPDSYRMGTLGGVKLPGCDVNHQLPSSAEVKERVELYLY